jgi:hypothetical protein
LEEEMATKVFQQSDHKLIVETDTSTFAKLCLFGGLACAVIAVVKFLSHPRSFDSESLLGLLAGTIIFLLAFLAVLERNVFVFDRARQLVRWQRRRVFSNKSGETAFAEIQAVIAQRPIGDDGTPSRRIALLARGQEIPLSLGYDPDVDDACLRLAEQIREFIGHSSQPDFLTAVRVAVSQGNIIEAVRLVQEEKQLSLAEAKDFIAELRRTQAEWRQKA